MGLNHKEQAGIIPRFCEDLFERIHSCPEVWGNLREKSLEQLQLHIAACTYMAGSKDNCPCQICGLQQRVFSHTAMHQWSWRNWSMIVIIKYQIFLPFLCVPE